MSMLPSEYFRRNLLCHLLVREEQRAGAGRGGGEDSILFETDFPHPTCLYPKPLDTVAEKMSHLAAAVHARSWARTPPSSTASERPAARSARSSRLVQGQGSVRASPPLPGGSLNDVLMATATPSYVGWVASWTARQCSPVPTLCKARPTTAAVTKKGVPSSGIQVRLKDLEGRRLGCDRGTTRVCRLSLDPAVRWGQRTVFATRDLRSARPGWLQHELSH